ncbi:MAG: VWA domain-containing protein [Treponema sp.]|nr:VWA domain-containing protein [Treponema sp.]
MNIGFSRPVFLAAAFFITPFLIFISRYYKPLFSLDIPLGPPGGIAFKSPINLKLLLRILYAMELAGVFLLFTAAAGPHFIYSETVWLNRGADIMFVLDVSPSMAGLDMNGRSRLEAAKLLLSDFADRRGQDSIGLVATADEAALLVPLTTDRDSLHSRLDALVVGELGDGTALGTGLAMAALHINKSNAPRKAVVLITDGENNAGSIHPEAAAAMLGDMGVSLWVIGVGSSGDVPISYIDPNSGLRRSGTFESHYDTAKLEKLALAAGGFWIHAPSSADFAAAFSRLGEGEMVIRRSGTVRREEPFYFVFAAAALILLWGVRLIRRYCLGALI